MQEVGAKHRKFVLVCTNVKDDGRECCAQKGSQGIFEKLKATMKAKDPSVRVSRTGCLGHCETGVTVAIMPDGQWFGAVTEADIPAIVERAS
jgi:NADH:ubiquinone oxidoreductase subunit E